MSRRALGTIYGGKVGAKMRPVAIRGWSRRIVRQSVSVTGGPYDGRQLRLDIGSVGTLPFAVGAHAGHYHGSTWVPTHA